MLVGEEVEGLEKLRYSPEAIVMHFDKGRMADGYASMREDDLKLCSLIEKVVLTLKTNQKKIAF